MGYKWCVVPQCKNTSISTQEKLFVSVPVNVKRRKRWLELAHRDPKGIGANSNVFMCEDHFNIEKDVANYMQYKMGYSQRILLVDGVIPSKFNCQDNRKRRLCDPGTSRAVIEKRQIMDLIEECEKESLLHQENIIDTSVKNNDNVMHKTVEIEPQQGIKKETVEVGDTSQHADLSVAIANMRHSLIYDSSMDHRAHEETQIKEEYDNLEIKFSNIQDYLDIGETVISEQDRAISEQDRVISERDKARAGPSSKGDVMFQTNIHKNKKTSLLAGQQHQLKCDICGYQYRHPGSLKRHMRNNSGEKHKCRKQYNLKTRTQEKLYKCEICDYQSQQRCHIKRHMRTHVGDKPYKCEICGYRGRQLHSLEKHMLKHTGEKPYMCEVCDYKCLELRYLRRHVRTHTGFLITNAQVDIDA